MGEVKAESISESMDLARKMFPEFDLLEPQKRDFRVTLELIEYNNDGVLVPYKIFVSEKEDTPFKQSELPGSVRYHRVYINHVKAYCIKDAASKLSRAAHTAGNMIINVYRSQNEN